MGALRREPADEREFDPRSTIEPSDTRLELASKASRPT